MWVATQDKSSNYPFYLIHNTNIRSMTKLESWPLLEYLVRTWLVGRERPRLKEFAIIKRSSLIEE